MPNRIPVLPFILFLAAGPVQAEPMSASDRCRAPALEKAEIDQLRARAGDRLGSPPAERSTAVLRLAADRIARSQDSEKSCRKAIERGEKQYEKALRRETRSARGNAGKADSDDPAIRAVQERLRAAFIADQAARLAYLELATDDENGADYWARQLATARAIELDGVHTQLLRELLEDWDWIDAHRFGPRIASHAWVLAQHADANPDFQQEVLERMRPYLEDGGVRPRDYAYLFDRVAVNQGRPQRYGTQPEGECNADRSLSPKPLEDPTAVDQLRAELGMEPMADAMAEMAARRCR